MERARYGVRDEIRETAEKFYRAISKKNLKAVESIWAHEAYAAVAGRSGHIRLGWPAVQSYWDLRFRELGDTVVQARLRSSVCHAVGDVGWLSGTEVRTVTTGDEKRQEELRMTCILERRASGWLIVSYHASEPAENLEAELAPAS